MGRLLQFHFFPDLGFQAFAELLPFVVWNGVSHVPFYVNDMAGPHLPELLPAVGPDQLMELVEFHSIKFTQQR